MTDGCRKAEPPTLKKLPVEVDVPEFLANMGRQAKATALQQAVGGLTLIAFYYLRRIGEYTGKPSRNGTKQTEQFKLCGKLRFFAGIRREGYVSYQRMLWTT